MKIKAGDLVVTHNLKCPEGMKVYHAGIMVDPGGKDATWYFWVTRFQPGSRMPDPVFHLKCVPERELIPHLPPGSR